VLTMKTYRGRLNTLQKYRKPGDPDLLAAERDLNWCQLDKYARKAVGDNPLTRTQIDGIIAILTAGVQSDAAA